MHKFFLIFSLILTLNFELSTFNSFSQTTVCQGDTVVMIVDNPTGTIQWQQSANQTTWTDITGETNDSLAVIATTVLKYRALMNYSACTIPYNYYSDTLTFNILSYLPVSVSISASTTNTICAGTSVQFNATAVNGGTSPAYRWYRNDIEMIGVNSSMANISDLADNDTITCVLTSSFICTNGNPAVSNKLGFHVLQAPLINPGPALSDICQGGTSAALGGSFGGGATSAIWSAPSGTFTNNSGSTPGTATYTAASNSTSPITLTLTTSGGSCGIISATKQIVVNPNPTVSAGGAIAAICQSGTSAALGGSFGGGATSAIWSAPSGTFANNSGSTPCTATYTAASNSTSPITLTLTTSGGSCGTVTANKQIVVNTNPTVNAGGVIAAICQSGTSAALGGSFGGSATSAIWSAPSGTFTNNSGSTPGTATYTAASNSTSPITLTLTTSGGSCGVATDSKQIVVNPNLSVSVSISANPGTYINPGTSVTYTATATNGGTSPSYQWKLNGNNVGTNSNTYTNSSLVNGNTVTCVLTSNAICPTGNPATSNTLTMIVITNCGTVTDIDGNVYHTVTIGTQCWMLENLKVTHYRNGDSIPNVIDATAWSGLSTGAYCNYNNDSNNATTYGRLYNWYALDDSRKIAPAGWHLPSDAEWTQLTDYLGGESVAGGKLKEIGTIHWNSPNIGATNETGFTALPGGDRHYSGQFRYMKNYGYWWSSSESDTSNSLSRTLNFSFETIGRYSYPKVCGFSVRCIKDISIGDVFGGGVVAYIFQTGDPGYVAGQTHGLIAAPSDQSTGAEWGCYGTALSGADGTAIGTGSQNTTDIITGCTTAGIAAKICYDLVLNGYSDWYLPSKDELNKLFLNRAIIGGFISNFYWSSTESDSHNAWYFDFNNGFANIDDKSNPNYVRAVRAF